GRLGARVQLGRPGCAARDGRWPRHQDPGPRAGKHPVAVAGAGVHDGGPAMSVRSMLPSRLMLALGLTLASVPALAQSPIPPAAARVAPATASAPAAAAPVAATAPAATADSPD